MRMWSVGALAALMSLPLPAVALQYQFDPTDNGKYVIVARGPIVAGDAERLRNFIVSNAAKGTLLGLSFDSPGGNLVEGEAVANVVLATNAAVLVADNATCASACFLILAAARVKLAGATALIGVHSASEGSGETTNSMAMTTAMARDASGFGVPPSIIGRMVATEPGRVAWLTTTEMTAMGVKVLDQTASAAAPTPSPVYSPPAPTVPTASVAPGTPMASGAAMSVVFLQGKADRRLWEEWFASLGPDARAGAQFWASQRSLAHPVSCQAGALNAEWLTACMSAQQRLAPTDVRRRQEPNYRLGWNTY